MPELRDPSPVQHRSVLAALAEYRLEGLHTDLDVDALTDARTFARRIAEGTPDALVPERDRVPHRILWWVQGPECFGRLRLNLELNDELREFGGPSVTTSAPPPEAVATRRRCSLKPWSSPASTGSRRCC